MTKFYEKLNFSEFEEIKQDLKLDVLNHASANGINYQTQSNWFTDINLFLKYESFNAFYKSLDFLYDLDTAYTAIVFTLNPYEIRPAHVDPTGNVENLEKIFLGLNIPLDNNITLMKWYQDTELRSVDSSKLKALFPVDFGSLKEIDRCHINSPTIVRTDKLHSAENLSDQRRYVVSIRFKRCKQSGLESWINT
jgi:hypothetical protein